MRQLAVHSQREPAFSYANNRTYWVIQVDGAVPVVFGWRCQIEIVLVLVYCAAVATEFKSSPHQRYEGSLAALDGEHKHDVRG